MANNLIQVKRTSVSGRAPNTTNLSNTSYILPGELALNMADGVLYSSNGSDLIAFTKSSNLTVRSTYGSGGGVNTTVYSVTGINFDESTGLHVTDQGSGNVFVSLGSGYKYITVSGQTTITAVGEDTLDVANGENIYLTTSNTAPKTLTIAANLASYIKNSYTGDLSGNINFTGTNTYFSQNITVEQQLIIDEHGDLVFNNGSGIQANGTWGTAGQVFTTDGSGNVYWSTVTSGGGGGGAGVNVDSQYTWTNTQTFSNTLYINNDYNYINNDSQFVFGLPYVASISNTIVISANLHNTHYNAGPAISIGGGGSGAGGDTVYAPQGGIYNTQANIFLVNTSLIQMGNSTSYINVSSATVFFGGGALSSVNSTIYTGTSYTSNNANNSSYLNNKLESNLNVNNALTANNSSYLNNKTEGTLNVNSAIYANTANTTNYIIANTGLVSNLSGVFVNTAYINAISANAATYLNGKTESNLNVNNALTSNSATYLGTKTESNLNVNSALTANNSSYLNNKTESNLNVNSSITANNSSYLNNKTESNLNVNSALTSNSATYLGTKTESNLNVNSALTSNTANTANYIIANTGIVSNSVGVFVNTAFINTISANAASYLNGKTESNLNVNNALTSNSSNYIGTLDAANVVSNSQLSSNLSYYTNTAGLPNVVGNNTANDVFYVNGVTSVNVVSNGQLTDNLARFTPTSSFYLDTLQDVSAGGPTSGQILTWNSTTNQWTPQAPPTVVTGVTPGYYGSFYDANANQTISSTTSAYLVRVANTYEQNGITVVNNTDITFAYTGTYEIVYSIQFFNNDNSQQDINVWFYKNGNNNITNSDSKFTINGKSGTSKGKLIAVTPFLITFNAGDYVRLAWAATDTGVEITTDAAGTTPATPVVPGVIVTVKQISNIISAPPGTNSQIMFNDSGVSNATAGFTFNKTTNNITTGNSLFVTSTVNAAAFTVDSQFIANSTFVYANNGVNFTPKAGSTSISTEGSVFYDSLNHALNVYTDIGDPQELGQQTFARVYNATGSTITKGTAVYINGANANRPTIGKAISNGSIILSQSIGLVYNDIPATTEGFVLTGGLLQSYDTRNYSIGQQIYISATTAGSLSNTQPSYPNYSVPIGYALNSALSGQIYLNISPPTLSLPNTNIYISNGTSAFVSNNFTFDYANSVLQIGNSTVNGTIGYVNTSGTTTFLRLNGNSNSSLDSDITNYSLGANASSDFAAYDSNGPLSSNFIDMGISGINFSQSFWTISGPSDGYLYTGNNALAIGTAQAYPIKFFTGDTLAANERMRISPTGNVGINNTNPLDSLSINGTTYHSGKTTFNANLVLNAGISVIDSKGAQGTSGQVLTSNGSGNVYWSTLLGVNVASQYAFTNTISFSNVVTYTANVSVNGAIIANGGAGTSGQVLTSSAGGNVYWSSGSSLNVNSALTANSSTYIIANTGLVSNAIGVFVNSAYINTISANLAYYVLANTGLVSNATGVFVNSAYINTISANAATYLNGKTEGTLNVNSALYANNSNTTNFIIANTGLISNSSGVFVNSAYVNTISANLAYYVLANTGIVSNATGVFVNQNTQYAFTNTISFSNVVTHTANVSVNGAIIANGGAGTSGQVLTSSAGGNVYWSSISGVNVASQYAWTNTQSFSNAITFNSTANLTFNTGAKIIDSTGSQGLVGQVLTSNGVGNVYWSTVSGGGGSVNTANQYVFTNTITFNANLSVNGAIFLGGSNGQVGQVLTSNGTGNAYWSTVSGGGSFSNGASITVSNIAYSNTTGTSTGVAYQFINTISGSLDTVFS